MAYALKYSLSVSIPLESESVYSLSYFQSIEAIAQDSEIYREEEEKAERKRREVEKARLDAEFEVVWSDYLAKKEREEERTRATEVAAI